VHLAGYGVLAAACLLLWPSRWGGSMTYVITHGTSMEPRFSSGDLAILRSSDGYDVGDIAAYRSARMKTVVMHRITAKTPAGYSFRGDNNDFTDPDVVPRREVLGKLVTSVPNVGGPLRWLVDPLHLALAIGGIFLLFSKRESALAPVLGPASDPIVVRIKAFRLPADLPRAEVVDASDLLALARAHGLAILRDESADYVLQGGLVFRCAHTASVRRRATGRDWAYPDELAA
jgi:signal peptidase I